MAADTDIITLGEAQAFVQSYAAGSAPTLELTVSAVSNRIDALYGPVVQREVEDEVALLGPLGEVQLVHYPVVSVSSVVETVNDVDTTIAASGYTLEASFGQVVRAVPIRWADTVTVSYIAGRYATTADVPPWIRLNCGEIVGEVFRQNAARWQRRSDAFTEDEEPGGYQAIDELVRRRFPTRPARALSIPVVTL